MSKNILVPDIGDFENVEIIEVLVKQGDLVKKDDPLITLESDKSSVEVPSTVEGRIENLKIKVGDKVSKGDIILSISPKIKDTKEIIPPATEKIIEEAEKILKKEKIQKKINNLENTSINKKDNRIFVSNDNDIDPFRYDWSINCLKRK